MIRADVHRILSLQRQQPAQIRLSPVAVPNTTIFLVSLIQPDRDHRLCLPGQGRTC